MNKITEKYTSTIDTAFILGNPLGEENPSKNFLIINNLSRVQEITQPIQKILLQEMRHPSSSFTHLKYQLAS
jgi:hypothetical protein